jgi:DNA-directed RNA polymerase I, II, and III subunit RPABC3
MGELFNGIYRVLELDRGGKQFDNLSRIYADSDSGSTIILDVNCNLFPVTATDTLQLVISSSDSAQWDPAIIEKFKGVWDYVMHGKIYKYEEGQNRTGTIHVSCGGLLLALTDKQSTFRHMRVGSDAFVQVRRL